MKQKSKSRLGWFSQLVLILNVVVAAATVLSYLAPSTNPIKFWPVAFFGLAYPILLPANGVLILYWLLMRARYSLISILTLLLGLNNLTGTIGFRLPESSTFSKPAIPSIRLVTYNVHFFKRFEDNENSVLVKELILSVMEKEHPDIICLQEAMTRKSGDFDTFTSLKKLTGLKYTYFVPNADNSYEAQGLVIFSRFPIFNTESIIFPNTSRGNEAICADIFAYGKKIRVYNVHFQSIGFQPEDYKYLDDVKGINTDDIKSSKRIGSRLKKAFLLRSEQARFLKEHTKKCKTPFIVAGDFNDTPGSFTVNTMAKDLQNTFREKGSGLGITYNGDFPNFQIDYILASRDFTVQSYHIASRKLSDHYAVRSDLVLKDQ